MKLGLETESLHLWFQHKRMDIFGFIDKAHELGLDGVQINVIKDYNLDEQWGTLGSADETHLKKIKDKLKAYDMYVELDMRNLEYERLTEVLRVAHMLGARFVRSYVPITINRSALATAAEGAYDIVKVKQDFDPKNLRDAVEAIRRIEPLLKKYRITLCLENHEYETADELVALVQEIASPWVQLLFDFGNSMMAWENPMAAVRKMAPYVKMTHCKDHIIIPDESSEFGYVVCGVPIGEGNLDVPALFDVLYETSPVERLNIEMCYPYCAEFKRSVGTGGVYGCGEGAFAIRNPLYPIKPSQYYYPHEVSEAMLEQLLVDQMRGVEKSVSYIKRMLEQYE